MALPRQREALGNANIEILHSSQTDQGACSRRRTRVGIPETICSVYIPEYARVATAIVTILNLVRPGRHRESPLPIIDVPRLIALDDAWQPARKPSNG